jgi:hypothetical protein
MDPFAPFKLIAIAWAWWTQRVGLKWLLILFGLAIFAVLILGCRETYSR